MYPKRRQPKKNPRMDIICARGKVLQPTWTYFWQTIIYKGLGCGLIVGSLPLYAWWMSKARTGLFPKNV